MSGLGNVQPVGNSMHAHAATGGKQGNGKQTAGNSESTISKAHNSREAELSPHDKPVGATRNDENLAERVISEMDEREKYLHTIDLSFGVEKLSYKNMWRTLKTVVKEIGDIKEANENRFALGVEQRLDEAPTLMEFTSFEDYLSREIKDFNEDSWKANGAALAHEIAENAISSKETIGNISPHRVVFLLTETK